MKHSRIVSFTWMAVILSFTLATDCDTSDPPSTNPFYKAFCGKTFIVGFSDEFSPYSWYVDPTEEEEETLRYVTSVPDHATIDGWLGLDPDIMDEVADFLGFNYTVVNVRLPGSNDTWTSVLTEYMLEIDIMGNNFALSSEREAIGYFSAQQVDMSSFLVQLSSYEASTYTWQDAFRFVAPFSSGVWIALSVCMVVSALVVFVLDWSFYVDRRVDDKVEYVDEGKVDKEAGIAQNFENEKGKKKMSVDRKNSTQEIDDSSDDGDVLQPISLFDSFYLAFASFTGAEQFSPVSKPSKIFVASWSVLVLLVLSTYTANLAATLTKNNSFVEEIQSVEDAIILGAKTCVSTKNVYYPSLPTSYSNTDELSQLYPFLEVNGLWTDLFEYLQNGTCRVALFNREDINAALQDQTYCDLIVVGGMSDSDGNGAADSQMMYFGTGLVLNFNDTETLLYTGINAALQYLLRSGKAQTLRETWAGGVCTLDSEEEEDEVTSIQLKHLIGPFAVHFSVGCAIILYAIFRHIAIYYNWDRKYFKWDMAVHTEQCEDDSDEDEDKFETGDNNNNSDEFIMTKQFLFEINQRMMSLENEVKISNNRHQHPNNHANDNLVTPLSGNNFSHSPSKPPGKGYDMGDSFQSTYSVHEFDNMDLDGKGKQEASGYFENSRVMSDMSGVGMGGGGNASGVGGMSMRSMKKSRKKMKKKSQYDVRAMRHVSSVHIMR